VLTGFIFEMTAGPVSKWCDYLAASRSARLLRAYRSIFRRASRLSRFWFREALERIEQKQDVLTPQTTEAYILAGSQRTPTFGRYLENSDEE
jgi:hypothetical protein